MKKILKVLLLLVLTLSLVACGGSSNDDSATEGKRPDKIKFGVTGIEGMEQLQTEFGAFKDELEKVLGVPVEFYALSDNASAITALEFEQVDLLLAGGSEYVMVKDSDNSVYPIAGLTRPGYIPVILSHVDSGIESIDDIQPEHKLGTRNVGSTSGHLMPLKTLIDAGLDIEKDITVLELGKSNEGAFLAKEIDLLPTTLLNYEELKAEEGIDFNIVIEGDPLPNDLLIGGGHLAADYIDEIREAIIANSDALMAGILASEENEKYSESAFIEAKDSDYDELREAYKVLGIEYN
ncbi:MAG: PhnD/SsuA/transferrin family substrate-binding protein [Erysipelotrichaceae bacterium]|nr:PhnD/SsuA/transferrin family substrate-binding protein [Erysipelotrichaceae bacterium]